MPWIIGIDEAGYGPNLGPFVMSSVACRVPDRHANADLWQVLGGAVYRGADPKDGRIHVDDSKAVYSSGRGLANLETGALALLGNTKTLADHLDQLGPSSHALLCRESWYHGTTPLPLEADGSTCARATSLFQEVCTEQGISWDGVQSVVICPAEFNRLLDRWDSKGAVLGHALGSLLRSNRVHQRDEPVACYIDKHGGRNTYTAMLQDVFPEEMIVAQAEGASRSSYRMLTRNVSWTFQPRADAAHLGVALASMVSKYLREVLMHEFNRFWQHHVPDLQPTAGYPADAARFLAQVRPAAQKLGLSEESLWRRK